MTERGGWIPIEDILTLDAAIALTFNICIGLHSHASVTMDGLRWETISLQAMAHGTPNEVHWFRSDR